MMALAMVVIASMIGTRGLGDEVCKTYTSSSYDGLCKWFGYRYLSYCF